jgi:hypothetical protein
MTLSIIECDSRGCNSSINRFITSSDGDVHFGNKTLSITTLSIMTLSIMTLSITTLSITTLSRTTYSIKSFSIMTFSITINKM